MREGLLGGWASPLTSGDRVSESARASFRGRRRLLTEALTDGGAGVAEADVRVARGALHGRGHEARARGGAVGARHRPAAQRAPHKLPAEDRAAAHAVPVLGGRGGGGREGAGRGRVQVQGVRVRACVPGVYPEPCRSSDFPKRCHKKIASERRISRAHPPNRFCVLWAPCSSESDRLVHPWCVRVCGRTQAGALWPGATVSVSLSHARTHTHAHICTPSQRYLVATRVFTDPERTTMAPPDMPGPSTSKQPAKKAKVGGRAEPHTLTHTLGLPRPQAPHTHTHPHTSEIVDFNTFRRPSGKPMSPGGPLREIR
jgi:hypothetical protein